MGRSRCKSWSSGGGAAEALRSPCPRCAHYPASPASASQLVPGNFRSAETSDRRNEVVHQGEQPPVHFRISRDPAVRNSTSARSTKFGSRSDTSRPIQFATDRVYAFSRLPPQHTPRSRPATRTAVVGSFTAGDSAHVGDIDGRRSAYSGRIPASAWSPRRWRASGSWRSGSAPSTLDAGDGCRASPASSGRGPPPPILALCGVHQPDEPANDGHHLTAVRPTVIIDLGKPSLSASSECLGPMPSAPPIGARRHHRADVYQPKPAGRRETPRN